MPMVLLATLWALSAGQVEVSTRPLTDMTKVELHTELKLLESNYPSIAGPITMISIGAGLLGYGAILLAVAQGPSGVRVNNPLTWVFSAMIAVGVGLLAPGAWLLWLKREERAVLSPRMEAIGERLEQLDRAEQYRQQHEEPPAPATGYQL